MTSWAMSHGAAILFWIAIFMFLVSFAGQMLHGSPSNGASPFTSNLATTDRGWFTLLALSSALGNAAYIFGLACIVDVLAAGKVSP